LTLPRPRSTVVYRDLPEGAILFCTSTEVYFSLNPIGARIWQLLPPVCTTEEQVVARLSEEYPDINLGKIAADVHRLMDELVSNELADSSRAP
jgi:coenzyme PQQ synthesis protein D (PqqD)